MEQHQRDLAKQAQAFEIERARLIANAENEKQALKQAASEKFSSGGQGSYKASQEHYEGIIRDVGQSNCAQGAQMSHAGALARCILLDRV